MSRPLADAVTARVAGRPDGVQALALSPTAGGDGRRLGLPPWGLAVRGLGTVRHADSGEPQRVLPGPRHGVAARFAATCSWCRDRLAAFQGATR